MKKIFLFLIIISFWACDDDTKDDTKDVALNQTEIDDLKFMREEEKLAYDVYSYAFDKYNIDIFSNIASSELQHTTKVLSLIEQFDIEDPVGDNGRGIYSNSDFTDLYVALTAEVDKSINDAYQVGALIEDLDIKDLDEVMERTSNQDIINVYENLQCGSRNHLRSFYSQIINIGDTFVAKYISQERLTSIINSPNENCGQ